ncbi:MAG: PAS domain S-box protein, partial [Thaumarchaeota archaeon]
MPCIVFRHTRKTTIAGVVVAGLPNCCKSKIRLISHGNPLVGLPAALLKGFNFHDSSGCRMSEETGYPYSGIACDNTGVITSYGIGAKKLFGWTADEVVGKKSVTIFHEPQAIATLVPRL